VTAQISEKVIEHKLRLVSIFAKNFSSITFVSREEKQAQS